MNKNLSYLLTAIVSGVAGWFFYSATHPNDTQKTIPGTTALKIKDGKYFLVFIGAVEMSREITQEEYDVFINKYPSGVAPFNILDRFSSSAPKYTKKQGRYYEYVWDGNSYGKPVEITKEEYGFLTNKQMCERFMVQ